MFRQGGKNGPFAAGPAVLLALAVLVPTAGAQAGGASAPPAPGGHRAAQDRPVPQPVYHIPLRVHLGKSGRHDAAAFRPVLDEINAIWLSQAGICFEMQIVETEDRRKVGMDLWFMPILPGGMWLNGYYRDDHEIHVRNRPELGPAEHPARHPAARTAAHELGHGLGLRHRQDSDDNLMRSRTSGWQLNDEEVRIARETAKHKALSDAAVRKCGIAAGTALLNAD
jgi:hypothetical protein